MTALAEAPVAVHTTARDLHYTPDDLAEFVRDSHHCRHGKPAGQSCVNCPAGIAVQPITVIGWNSHGRPMLVSELLALAGLPNHDHYGEVYKP